MQAGSALQHMNNNHMSIIGCGCGHTLIWEFPLSLYNKHLLQHTIKGTLLFYVTTLESVIGCSTVTIHSCEFLLLHWKLGYCCCDAVNIMKMCVQHCIAWRGLLRIETLQNVCWSFVRSKSAQVILSQISTPNIPAQPLAQETGCLRPRLVESTNTTVKLEVPSIFTDMWEIGWLVLLVVMYPDGYFVVWVWAQFRDSWNSTVTAIFMC